MEAGGLGVPALRKLQSVFTGWKSTVLMRSQGYSKMSEGELILPDENAPIDWKRYCLRLDFYPKLKLSRREALRFADTITEYLEPEEVRPGTTDWHFIGGSICEGLHVRIRPSSVMLDAHDPSNRLEWYEHRFAPMLEIFHRTFSPEVALHCNVVVSGLIQLPEDVDAQSFLGGYVMMMHPHKLAPIERPLHVLGVRLLFPPFEVFGNEEGGEDWGVDVRVESAISGKNKLFLEADADWQTPVKWDDDFSSRAISRLGIVSTFMSDKLVKFLRQPPFPEGEEDDEQ